MSPAGVTFVIPVKELGAAKSRLTPVLDNEARRRLALEMFTHVLDVCVRARGARVVVVSPDEQIGELAGRADASWVRDPEPGLNRSVARVFASCWRQGERPLYLPSDLPIVETSDLLSLVAADSGKCVVICPSHDRRGTNALLVPPEAPLVPELGEDSFAKHLLRARERGYDVAVNENAHIAFDIDTPSDWTDYCVTRAEHVASS